MSLIRADFSSAADADAAKAKRDDVANKRIEREEKAKIEAEKAARAKKKADKAAKDDNPLAGLAAKKKPKK